MCKPQFLYICISRQSCCLAEGHAFHHRGAGILQRRRIRAARQGLLRLDAAGGGAAQGGGDPVAGLVVGEDVGLDEDLGGGAVDRRLEGREELGAVLEQAQGVAAQPGDLHRLRRCAAGR